MNTALPATKRPDLEYELHELLRQRWSPRAFRAQPLPSGAPQQLMEAARWAASSSNQQPWRFVWTLREDASFGQVVECLSPGNRPWAQGAAALVCAIAAVQPPGQARPNRHAWYDLGQAVSQLSLQAAAMGLAIHQMAGFDPVAAQQLLQVPAGFEPATMLAVGALGEPELLPEPYRERELTAPRQRVLQSDFACHGQWGQSMRSHAGHRVLAFWFGELGENGLSTPEQLERWWQPDTEFDQQIREQFLEEHAAILDGRRNDWLLGAASRLAWILVLDQYSRNMFRGAPQMYAADDKALHAALAGIALGMDRCLPTQQRCFYYLPLMHSEELENQEQCVSLFTALHDELDDVQVRSRVAHSLEYARGHRDVIRRWGRFPHRNAILGRTSKPKELAYLQEAS